MNTEEILITATECVKLAAEGAETSRPESNRLDVKLISTAQLIPVVAALRVKRLGFLSAITGLDLGVEAGALEVLYHFCSGEAVITLRAQVPREAPSVPSLWQIIPSAETSERELSEMFGVTVDGLRNTDHLYLPDEWPEGLYPLRKDHDPRRVLQPL
jgi:NADH:ubiquinone oxidoreductase subunit C